MGERYAKNETAGEKADEEVEEEEERVDSAEYRGAAQIGAVVRE